MIPSFSSTPAFVLTALAASLSAALPAYAKVDGVVVGPTGYFQNAQVCIDSNGNGRCDDGEAVVRSNEQGKFTLAGNGPVAVAAGTDAMLYDPATGVSTPVAKPLALRTPAGGRVVAGPVSTELVALAESKGGDLIKARRSLASRLGVKAGRLLDDPNTEADGDAKIALAREGQGLVGRIADAVAEAGDAGDLPRALRNRLALDRIDNVVVIYAENRSFNNLFGRFPGARGVADALANYVPQKDRDGSTLSLLPPAWGGLTAAGQDVVVTQAQTTNALANRPFEIDAVGPWGYKVPSRIITRDMYHRFYENQMQIGDGSSDQFVAWADSGDPVMGYYGGRNTRLWDVAKKNVLADNFFQGAFGGSFLNHQYLICACAPEFPNADTAPSHPTITVLDTDGSGNYLPHLTQKATSPASAMDGPPQFVLSGNITPKNYFGDGSFYGINTMQPPYQPSGNAPAGDDTTGLYSNPLAATWLPPQTATTIGDLMDHKGVSWAWYSGAWNLASADRSNVYKAPVPNFQAHHQPFNYYAEFDPVAHADYRKSHLKDYDDLVAQAAAGTLPALAFFKPQGNLNQHPGYANIDDGDAHIADLIAKLQASPQWKHMLVVVTYDENGGEWDHIRPPKGDLIGPGSRIPALIVSPFVKKGMVDHTAYDTASALRFVTHRFSLPVLPGLQKRDDGLAAHGEAPMGDFTNALDFGR